MDVRSDCNNLSRFDLANDLKFHDNSIAHICRLDNLFAFPASWLDADWRELPPMRKDATARRIIDRIEELDAAS